MILTFVCLLVSILSPHIVLTARATRSFESKAGQRNEYSFGYRRVLAFLRGGATEQDTPPGYGRISTDEYRLTPEQIQAFHRDGCITLTDVLTPAEVNPLCDVFDRFVSGDIDVPGKDFCDMSQPFGTPYDDWNLVNCMLPTRYYPPLSEDNIYERLTQSIAAQLFPQHNMVKDYDQLLNKRPNRTAAVFAWHQDMAYWPGPAALNVSTTATCTFSLALDDSDAENGCLQYVPRDKSNVTTGSTQNARKVLLPHRPAVSRNRDEGHALVLENPPADDQVRWAPARSGSVTVHDEYVVHGSSGNDSPHRQRRTYVLAYRAREIVEAERRIGFTHSHNDVANWDTFMDGASHRNPNATTEVDE